MSLYKKYRLNHIRLGHSRVFAVFREQGFMGRAHHLLMLKNLAANACPWIENSVLCGQECNSLHCTRSSFSDWPHCPEYNTVNKRCETEGMVPTYGAQNCRTWTVHVPCRMWNAWDDTFAAAVLSGCSVHCGSHCESYIVLCIRGSIQCDAVVQ